MNIRQNLALKFCLIVASLFLLFAFSLYFFSSSYRQSGFNVRLKNRGTTVVNLLTDVKQIDNTLLKSINADTKNALFNETISVYDQNNALVYSDSKDSTNRQANIETCNFTYSVKDKPFKVIVSAFDKFGLDNLRNLKIILVVGSLIAILVSYIAGWFFSGLALNPISKIISDANEITVSKLNVRLNEGNRKDEIAQLSITFNKVLDRLEKGFEMQRAFVSNASHELRTPLTSITGHIEVTLKKERNTTDYVELLKSLLSDIRSLSKISNNLLDLALATTDVGALKLKNIRIDELLFSSKEKLLRNFPEYKATISFISFPEEEAGLTVFGNEPLMESAFFNVMENACKYSENRGVEVVFSGNKEGIELRFKDSGIGIPATELTKIIDPFYRATNARSIPGSGLGLSLTQKIIELHKGILQIHSVEKKGTEIVIVLPLIPSVI